MELRRRMARRRRTATAARLPVATVGRLRNHVRRCLWRCHRVSRPLTRRCAQGMDQATVTHRTMRAATVNVTVGTIAAAVTTTSAEAVTSEVVTVGANVSAARLASAAASATTMTATAGVTSVGERWRQLVVTSIRERFMQRRPSLC